MPKIMSNSTRMLAQGEEFTTRALWETRQIWGAEDRNGQTLPSATYFYLIRSIDESFETIRGYLEVQGSER